MPSSKQLLKVGFFSSASKAVSVTLRAHRSNVSHVRWAYSGAGALVLFLNRSAPKESKLADERPALCMSSASTCATYMGYNTLNRIAMVCAMEKPGTGSATVSRQDSDLSVVLEYTVPASECELLKEFIFVPYTALSRPRGTAYSFIKHTFSRASKSSEITSRTSLGTNFAT
jgi:hypothetical protein